MKRSWFTSLSSKLSALSLILSLLSCEQVAITEPDVADASYKVDANITLNNVWLTEDAGARKATRAVSEDDLLYQIYLFDSNDKAMDNNGQKMSKLSTARPFSCITTPGVYTFYGVTNLLSGEYTSTGDGVTLTSASTFTLKTEDAPNDVCLGKQTLTVEAKTQEYSVSITASHIMSKLAVAVQKVPTEVTSMTVTLPQQANVFDFTGKFTGNSTSQTLTLEKASTANTDGTYNWTCDPTIVFPCATGTSSMPITIHWESASQTKDVETTSTHCPLSGKNLSLSTTWSEAFRTSATITKADWSAVEEGTFDWQ